MKRNFKLLAAMLILVVMVLSVASCKLIKHSHEFSADWSYDETNHWHAATCDKKDDCASATADLAAHTFADGVCSVCGFEKKVEDEGPSEEHTHNFVDGKCECGESDPNYVPPCTEHAFSIEVTKEPTCTVAGEKKFTCTLCGHSYTSEVAPEGHTEVKIPGTAPTCTEKGTSEGKKCDVCGEILAEPIELNAKGHTFVEGACSVCGEIDPEYNGPKTYVLDVQTLTAFAAGVKADGATESVADFFTIYYSAKTKIDTTTNKTWPDGYSFAEGLRLNWGGTTAIGETTKNAIEINVDGTATVKVWWVCGGDGREIGIFDANGELVAASKTDDVFVESEGVGAGKNGVYLSELAIDAAGKYFIGTDNTNATKNGGNIICKVEVTVTPVVKNEIKVETTDTYTMYNLDFFTFTATAEGYYTFKIPAGLGVLRDGADAPEIDYYDNANGAEFTIGLEAEQEVIFWVSATTKDMWTIEWSFEAGEVENQPDTPIEGDATELVVGSNNLVFADGELSQGKTYPFTVTEEGTYTFRSDLMAVVMDADGNTLGRGQASLTPGTYSVTFFSMMPLPANSFVVNITFEAPATGEPDGSEENPFVWETLPESVTFVSDNANMVYYVFTATADGSVTFTWAVEGNDWFNYFELVDGMTTANNASGYAQTSHTFVIETGKTYRVGLGTWNEGGETVVTIAFTSCAHEWSEATCQVLSTCAKCGATTGDYADHIPNSENPTCGDPAECTVCGTEVGYIPHEWDEGEVIQQPDCSTETNGIKKLTCTVCGATQEEEIWAFHDWVVDEEIPVTCTEDGYYKAHCSVCNAIEEYTTEAEGHYNWYASCGETTTCMECGTEFTKNHEGSPATCTEPMYCYNCWQYIGEALGHNYVNGICSVCEAVDPDYVACEHSYFYACDKVCQLCGEITNPNATHTIVHVEAVAATCYENGNIEYWYCEICGYAWADEALTQQTNQMNVVVPMAHAPATHFAAKDATCTENGNLEYWLCEACGQAWLDADCTLNTNVKSVVLPSLGGHVDEGGDFKCDVCSTKMLPEDGATLTIAQALVIAKMQSHNTYTTQKYYITGIVTNLYNTQYGNFYIKDADGNELCIYGLYMDGTRYDAMNYKPVEGDEVTVYGPLGAYNTTYQMKNAELDDVVAHEHDYVAVVTDPTCVAAGFTTHTCSICKDSYTDSEVAALGHTTDNGVCDNCGLTIGGDAPVIGELARFDFGANGSAAHVDGNDLGTSKSYTAGSQTLALSSMSKVYGPAYDAKGNSCIKLGTSKLTGTFSFTVGENVTEVVIYVAGYKAATSTNITVNGVQYNVTTASNNGDYTAITIDTTTTKTITLTTVTYRCMIDTIVFNGVVA